MSAENGQRRLRLRVFPEWGCRWPFWMSDGNAPRQPTPSDLGISERLASRVLAWVRYWERHHVDETRWDQDRSRARYLEEADEIEKQLITEIGGRYEIVMLA